MSANIDEVEYSKPKDPKENFCLEKTGSLHLYHKIFLLNLLTGLSLFFTVAEGNNQTRSKKALTTSSTVKTETATLAGGCFWCVESDLEPLPGVKEVISGYTGGHKPNPAYKEVSSGTTGHREAVQVIFDPKQTSYAEILDVFWRKINPLDDKGQFVDRGFQYTSGIFYHTEQQKQLALQSKKELEARGPFKGQKIVTPIQPFTVFYRAEDYHQNYYKKNPLRYKFYRYRSGRDQFLEKTWEKFKDFRFFPSQKAKKITMQAPSSPSTKPSKEELKRRLTSLQYHVTQEEGTEKPFVNEYWNNKREGIYVNVVSGEPLFSSLDKYDSGTGWPSFTKPLVPENIVTKKDFKLLYPRTEVRSKKWDSHLGHVFKDGPPPRGLRYCINSAALRFIAKNKLKEEGYGKFTSLFENLTSQ